MQWAPGVGAAVPGLAERIQLPLVKLLHVCAACWSTQTAGQKTLMLLRMQ